MAGDARACEYAIRLIEVLFADKDIRSGFKYAQLELSTSTLLSISRLPRWY